MTTNSLRFGASLTAMLTAIDNAVTVLARARDLPRWIARQPDRIRRRVIARGQLAHFDDRMLRDIGLRRDEFPCAVRERQRDHMAHLRF